MSRIYRRGLHIFRRDLRLVDNTSLHHAVQKCQQVITCIILDPVQLEPDNAYRSIRAIEFMRQSLHDLDEQLREQGTHLYVFHGAPLDVLQRIYTECPFDALFFNKDYTPYATQRDDAMGAWADERDVAVWSFHDVMLTDPDVLLTKQQTPYTRYGAYLRAARTMPERHTVTGGLAGSWYTKPIRGVRDIDHVLKPQPAIINEHVGGRRAALRLLRRIKNLDDYQGTRDIPSMPTTFLSAHLKFGTLSVREVYQKVRKLWGEDHELIKQLYWRDFFTYIAYHFPRVFGHEFQEKYRALPWSYDTRAFKTWCEGNTGFPLVDAGMRQLNQTGFMHNRVRMVVASFLTKDLGIDWRLGEQYFAQQLIDYDPAVNNGNWQWVASTGCDAQPYFRVFNPWLQQKKFDPECAYITTWIPELRSVSPRDIHRSFAYPLKVPYPRPMLDHGVAARRAQSRYRGI